MNFLIVDGLNLIRRVFAGVPQVEGEDPIPAVQIACLGSLTRAIRRQSPSHAVCVMDTDQPSWRHVKFPEYKATRSAMPEVLRNGLPLILNAFREVGVKSIQLDPYEADDVIATIAVRVSEADGQASILSTDKSLCQVLAPGIRIYNHFADAYLDESYVLERFGVTPAQLVTFQALVGERSLNVPGVHGIGKRTAAQLIHDHGELSAILSASQDMAGNIGTKLRTGAADARRALQILTLRTDLELGMNVKDFRML